ncbi:MAG: sulfotransferase [Myxococcales bacterium]|nr:sulfotransferase [Myxococcales bacterium]
MSRLFQQIARTVARGLAPRRLEVEGLLQRAGVSTAELGEAGRGLEVLVQSLATEARLHALGRLIVRDMIVDALSIRGQLDAARAPLGGPGRVGPAVVVAGMPRTGTTLLQRLLALDPRAAWLPMWLLMQPLPVPTASDWATGGARRRRATASLWAFRRLVPELQHKHEVGSELPEECSYLFMPSFQSIEWWSLLPVPSYAAWLAEQEPVEPYTQFRDLLALYGRGRDPFHHWVLKSPMHFLFLEQLLDALPEAQVVLTHRDPRRAVASMNSLVRTTHGLVTDQLDVAGTARTSLTLLARRAQQAVRIRDERPARFHDVAYLQLVADPLGTLRALYTSLGWAWPAGHDERVRVWLAAHRQHRLGRHRYALADSSCTEAEVDRHFAPYVERFRPAREPR